MSYSINASLDNKMPLTQSPFPDPKICHQMFFYYSVYPEFHWLNKGAFYCWQICPKAKLFIYWYVVSIYMLMQS